jgi:hypothetical protein
MAIFSLESNKPEEQRYFEEKGRFNRKTQGILKI